MFRKYHKRYLQNVIHLSGFAANFSIFVKDFLQKKSRVYIFIYLALQEAADSMS